MASNKLARTNDDIQRVLANLLTQVKDPRVQQGMISVTRVETTGDLRYSKIWLSVLGMHDEKEFKKGLPECLQIRMTTSTKMASSRFSTERLHDSDTGSEA